VLIPTNGYCYAVGANGTIRRSTNNGTNWSGQTSGTNNLLYDVRFPNIGMMTILFAIGSNGTILKTTNAGVNWNPLTSGTNNDLHEIHFTTYEIGYTVGNNGTIRNTTNGGANWVSQTSGTTNNLWSVFFVGYTVGFAVGENGTIRKTTTGITGINPVSNNIPDNYKLLQNYPNPFNPSTNISFQLPKNSMTKISVYDILGNEVISLVNEQLIAGTYEISFDASKLPSGVYFCAMQAEGFSETKRMILSK
jgi:hypothetical protein